MKASSIVDFIFKTLFIVSTISLIALTMVYNGCEPAYAEDKCSDWNPFCGYTPPKPVTIDPPKIEREQLPVDNPYGIRARQPTWVPYDRVHPHDRHPEWRGRPGCPAGLNCD